jgi:HEAT repeat protein
MREAARFERAAGQLLAAVRDKGQAPAIRIFAARSLGELGPDARGTIEPLLETMQDPDPTVRTEIAKSIGKIGAGDAYLIADLRNLHEREEQTNVREALDVATKALKDKPASGSVFPLVIGGGGLTIFAAVGYWLWKQAKA